MPNSLFMQLCEVGYKHHGDPFAEDDGDFDAFDPDDLPLHTMSPRVTMKIGTERRLGATDAAPLLGVGKYGTPLSVFERVVLGKQKKASRQMLRGTRVEPEVRRRYQLATGAEFQQFVSRPLIVEHPTLEWATCSPDDVTVGDVLVEYKSASRWSKGWNPVPVDYVMQVLYALWVTQLERAHLFVCFGADVKNEAGEDDFLIGREEGPFLFTRDAELEAVFERVGGAFWRNHVLPRIPPNTDTQSEASL